MENSVETPPLWSDTYPPDGSYCCCVIIIIILKKVKR